MANNRERIDRMFQIVGDALLPFIRGLGPSELNDAADSARRSTNDDPLHDVSFLLQFMNGHWGVFRGSLEREHRTYVNELITVRNRLAHDFREPTDDHTWRSLDTGGRLLSQMAPEEAVKILKLRGEAVPVPREESGAPENGRQPGTGGATYRRRAKQFGVPFDPSVTLEGILKRDDWQCRMEVCLYADRAISRSALWSGSGPMPEEMGTIDHIVPLSAADSPGHVASNVRAAHRLCNREAFSPSKEHSKDESIRPSGDGRDAWTPADLDEALFVWNGMGEGARGLVDALLDVDEPVPWHELAALLGSGARDDTVYGSFGQPAKLAKSVGRRHIVRTTTTREGRSYSLDPIARELLQRAREA